MLVLTRKKDEMIQIGDSIVIKVISTGRGKVKIGIEAPEHIRVIRSELENSVTAPRNPEDKPRRGESFRPVYNGQPVA